MVILRKKSRNWTSKKKKRSNFEFSKTVEFLEAKLSSVQKDISSKEQSLLSELESIFQEHMEKKERINRAHFMLNKIEKEKTLEVENLEREVVSLTAQVSSTHEEGENATMDAIREVSVLRAGKAKFEANLQDVSAQLRHYESKLEDLRKESKNKIKGFVDSLNASKQSEEMLTSDAEHMKKLMEAAKSNEDVLRKTSNEPELKLLKSGRAAGDARRKTRRGASGHTRWRTPLTRRTSGGNVSTRADRGGQTARELGSGPRRLWRSQIHMEDQTSKHTALGDVTNNSTKLVDEAKRKRQERNRKQQEYRARIRAQESSEQREEKNKKRRDQRLLKRMGASSSNTIRADHGQQGTVCLDDNLVWLHRIHNYVRARQPGYDDSCVTNKLSSHTLFNASAATPVGNSKMQKAFARRVKYHNMDEHSKEKLLQKNRDYKTKMRTQPVSVLEKETLHIAHTAQPGSTEQVEIEYDSVLFEPTNNESYDDHLEAPQLLNDDDLIDGDENRHYAGEGRVVDGPPQHAMFTREGVERGPEVSQGTTWI